MRVICGALSVSITTIALELPWCTTKNYRYTWCNRRPIQLNPWAHIFFLHFFPISLLLFSPHINNIFVLGKVLTKIIYAKMFEYLEPYRKDPLLNSFVLINFHLIVLGSNFELKGFYLTGLFLALLLSTTAVSII